MKDVVNLKDVPNTKNVPNMKDVQNMKDVAYMKDVAHENDPALQTTAIQTQHNPDDNKGSEANVEIAKHKEKRKVYNKK